MTPDKPLPCPTCAKLTLWQKLFGHDPARQPDLRAAAKQHIISHDSKIAKGVVTEDVKAIANSNNGGK